MRFKLNESKDGQVYVEIQSDGNYATLFVSETYETEEAALHAIGIVKEEAGDAAIVYENAEPVEMVVPDEEPAQ